MGKFLESTGKIIGKFLGLPSGSADLFVSRTCKVNNTSEDRMNWNVKKS